MQNDEGYRALSPKTAPGGRLMAKLTSKQRAKLPARDFGLPEKARSDEARKETGNYPIPDKGHAISAKRLSDQQRKAGNLTKDEYERINRKADKVLETDSEE
jgi:hypothetical protein